MTPPAPERTDGHRAALARVAEAVDPVDSRWILWVPALLVAARVAATFTVLDPASAVGVAVDVAVVLVAGFATARLYDAVRERAANDGDWQPNPWRYVWGGAAALWLPLVAGTAGTATGATLVAVLVGTAVGSVVCASVVGGPAFALASRLRG